jgi:hypothetical protein
MLNQWTRRASSRHLVDDQTQSSTASDASSQPSDDAADDAMASKRREFSQSNLVSDDQPGHLNASIQDPNLINPWGVAFPDRAFLGQQQPHRHGDAV